MQAKQTVTNKDTKVITDPVRLSYVHLFEPHAAAEGQEAKYSVCALIPKKDEQTFSKLMAAVEAARLASAKKFNGKIPATLKHSVHDGDEEKPNGGEYGPECRGHWVVNCSSRTKPGVIDRDKELITNSDEVYSGCWARLSLNCYAYNAAGNRGIAVGLNNVQKWKDDDYLGGRSRAEDDFDDEYDDDVDYDDDLG